MDADLFAQIMYATEYLLNDFEDDEATNPENIPATIAKYGFDHKQHFPEVAEVFVKHVGPGPVQV